MANNKEKLIILKKESERLCSECYEQKECRPYGKRGSLICFECGMKDEDQTKRQFYQRVLSKKPN